VDVRCVDGGMRVVGERGVGAPAGFDDWFVGVWPRAFRLAAFMTHDAQAGEDVAQDVLFRMSQRWGSIERPDAYLQRALTNACRNWSRHSRMAESKLRLVATPEATETAFDDLADAVARLPFRQRAVVVLRYYGDLSEAEIAHALACRPGTVKSLASRALSTLSKEITR
jgi:RNA polymerase sigma factor (sigma-70 family)